MVSETIIFTRVLLDIIKNYSDILLLKPIPQIDNIRIGGNILDNIPILHPKIICGIYII